jgi:hypothetical protein
MPGLYVQRLLTEAGQHNNKALFFSTYRASNYRLQAIAELVGNDWISASKRRKSNAGAQRLLKKMLSCCCCNNVGCAKLVETSRWRGGRVVSDVSCVCCGRSSDVDWLQFLAVFALFN